MNERWNITTIGPPITHGIAYEGSYSTSAPSFISTQSPRSSILDVESAEELDMMEELDFDDDDDDDGIEEDDEIEDDELENEEDDDFLEQNEDDEEESFRGKQYIKFI